MSRCPLCGSERCERNVNPYDWRLSLCDHVRVQRFRRALRALARHAKRLRDSADLFDDWRAGTEHGVRALHDRIATVTAERDALKERMHDLGECADCPMPRTALTAASERDAARAALLELAKLYARDNPGGPGDWACSVCRPYSHCLIGGFLCAYHRAVALVDPSGERRGGR